MFMPCLATDTIRVCLSQSGTESSLYTSTMHFLCVLFTEEAKRRSGGHTEDLTSKGPSSSLTAVISSEPGEVMCELLLEVTQI